MVEAINPNMYEEALRTAKIPEKVLRGKTSRTSGHYRKEVII